MNGIVENYVVHSELHMLAFSKYTTPQPVIYISGLIMYLICIFGNLLVAITVCKTPQLHIPMYYFLCNLTILDSLYVSIILPKLLVISITGDTSFSYPGCFTQIFFYVFCIGTEFFLLTSMAYDRYVAICIPLRYMVIMKRRTCLLLTIFCCIMGVFNSLMYALQISRLSFPSCAEINHFFCQMKSVLNISCDNTTTILTLIIIDGFALGFFPFILILTSYIYIICTIVNVHKSSGRLKAFSSCTSHIIIVVLFCLTSLTLNMKPESKSFQEPDKLLSMLYIAFVPMLNPLVYSLRNHEILKAIKNIYFKTKMGINIFIQGPNY